MQSGFNACAGTKMVLTGEDTYASVDLDVEMLGAEESEEQTQSIYTVEKCRNALHI